MCFKPKEQCPVKSLKWLKGVPTTEHMAAFPRSILREYRKASASETHIHAARLWLQDSEISTENAD